MQPALQGFINTTQKYMKDIENIHYYPAILLEHNICIGIQPSHSLHYYELHGTLAVYNAARSIARVL
jgi:hypothetical protein